MKVKNIDGIICIHIIPIGLIWRRRGIEKAKLNFTSDIIGLNNNVTAHAILELTDIVRSPKPDESRRESGQNYG